MQITRTLGALALAAASLGAQAGTVLGPIGLEVKLTNWTFASGNSVLSSFYNGVYSGAAGGFKGTLTGSDGFDTNNFQTYCIEIEERFSFSSKAMTGYEMVDGASYFARRRGDSGIADRLGRLMSFVADDPSRVDSAAESSALQLAIWNMVYDTDYSVTTLRSFNDASALNTQADALLAGAEGTQSRYTVYALEKSGSQDLIVFGANAVPEPGSLALAGLALGGLVLTGRKKRA